MAEYTENASVWPFMVSLQQCLEEENSKAGLPPLSFIAPMAGSDLALYYAEGGQAWVRIVTAFPSTTIPAPDQRMAKCSTPLAFTIEVGVVRCAVQVKEDGEGPTAREWFEWTRMQAADMSMMHRAISCCVGRRDYVLGTYTPIGPAGNAVGGAWTLTVGAP